MFRDRWGPGETVKLPNLLVSDVWSIQTDQAITDVARVSVWCDEFRQEDVRLNLFEEAPKTTGRRPRTTKLHRFTRMDGVDTPVDLSGDDPEGRPAEGAVEVDELLEAVAAGEIDEGTIPEDKRGRPTPARIEFFTPVNNGRGISARIDLDPPGERRDKFFVVQGRVRVTGQGVRYADLEWLAAGVDPAPRYRFVLDEEGGLRMYTPDGDWVSLSKVD